MSPKPETLKQKKKQNMVIYEQPQEKKTIKTLKHMLFSRFVHISVNFCATITVSIYAQKKNYKR